MGRPIFIDVKTLELREIRFDEVFPPGLLSFPDDWRQRGDLRAEGVAELMDRHGSRTIRVLGRIRAEFENECAIGLEPIRRVYDENFELFYYPMSLIAREEHVGLSRDDADVGFYEGDGLPLADVVREQVLLWLPMRPECEYAEQGDCPYCKRNLDRSRESIAAEHRDSRWAALEKWKQN